MENQKITKLQNFLIKKGLTHLKIISTNYNNEEEEIEIKCEKHSIFKKKVKYLKRFNEPCSKCAKEKQYLNKNDFIEKCNFVHKNKYDYSITEYSSSHNKINIICPIHGIFIKSAHLHLNAKQGCPKCSKEKENPKKLSLEQVSENLKKCIPFYEFDVTTYKNALSKMKFICPIHGEFYQSYVSRLRGCKCLKCSRIEQPLKKRINKEIIFKRLEENKKLKHVKPLMYTYKTLNEQMDFYCEIHGLFSQVPNLTLTQYQSCPKCCSNSSNAEKEIELLFPNIFIINDRKLIHPKEIDLLSYNSKFGIEYNGLQFHSFGISYYDIMNNYHKIDKNKHLKKTELLEAKGYQLFHIREDHWLNPKKKDIWVSMISNKLGKSNRIFARKLKIVDLTTYKDFVNNFLEDNHLQGKCNYKFAYGLQNPISGEVYSIMTFGHSRFDKSIEYELIRFCSYKNFSIIGGASKILKYFEKVHQPKSLISYANRDWSQGNVYKQLGFKFIENTQPNYFYVKTNSKKIITRLNAQKHKLSNLLGEKNFDENLTELENMLYNNYRIYYDTGNIKFIKKY